MSAERPEIEPTQAIQPRIYVASLSDYNAGRLHGRWMDAARDPEELAADIAAMLAESTEPFAEEHAIHDHEGFFGWHLGEYESVEAVTAVARGIAEHGPAFAHWAGYAGTDPEALAGYEEAFLGDHRSMRDFAEQLVDDLGVSITVEPGSWDSYVRFDYDLLARDLEIEMYTSEHDTGIYVFDPTVL